jgi:hypothetical protein
MNRSPGTIGVSAVMLHSAARLIGRNRLAALARAVTTGEIGQN